MTEYYFKFEFTSIHNNIKNMNYYVLSENIEDIKLFLLQHNFTNVPQEAITLIEKSKTGKYDGNNILEPYRFRSNKSTEVFTVMTCWKFVEEAVSNLSADLNQFMLFGESIIRRDVEIFKLIGDLVNDIDHAHVVDFSLCDPDDIDEAILNGKDIMELHGKYKQIIGAPTEDSDMVMTYESLFESINDDDMILPITIECYINNFMEMMIDVFN